MKFRPILLLLYLLAQFGLFAQGNDDATNPDTTGNYALLKAIPKNVDSAFAEAREYAYAGEYQKARTVLSFLQTKYPDYKDLAVFKARTYLYEERFEKASQEAKAILKKDSLAPEETKQVLLKAKRYNDQLDTALFLADEGLKRDKKSEFYHVEKAQILRQQGEIKPAIAAVDSGLQHHPDNNELQQLRTFLLNQALFDGIAAGLNYDYFTPFSRAYSPWTEYFVQAGKLTRSGIYIARVNYAERLNSNGFQVEGEAYPIVGKGQYLYLNLGISAATIYPTVKGGAEYFTQLPRGFEGSIGFRYWDFRSFQVLGLTGSIAKYWGRNYLQYRPFFINEPLGWGNNHNFLYRHFFRANPDFIQLRAGFGYTLDQRIIIINSDRFLNTFYAESQYFGIGARKVFTSNVFGQAEFVITRQEDPEIRDRFFRIYTLALLLGYRF